MAKTTFMKLVTWNINHRARRKRIPQEMAKALCSLSPDVIVLTEYVPGPSHESFVNELSSSGFSFRHMSAFTPKENHILIVARSHMVPGEITGPPIAYALPSNVLHVRLAADKLDVLGIRVPDYSKKPAIRRACWDWIEKMADGVKTHPFVFLGDFNVDPSYPPSKCGDRISKLVASGWQHALPLQGVSYYPIAGGQGKRLDHAFVSGHFNIVNTQYVWEAGTFVFWEKAWSIVRSCCVGGRY